MWLISLDVLMAPSPPLLYGDLVIWYDPRTALRGSTEAMQITITPAERDNIYRHLLKRVIKPYLFFVVLHWNSFYEGQIIAFDVWLCRPEQLSSNRLIVLFLPRLPKALPLC